MRSIVSVAILWAVLFMQSCGDRALPGGGAAGTSGVAGASGIAGSSGVAGSSGAPGSSGVAGTSGTAGRGSTCDVTPIFQEHYCTLQGACHDAQGSAANFDMASPGLEKRIVGVFPRGGGVIPSMCMNVGIPYLMPGSVPATGLFLQKLRSNHPPCGEQEPPLGPALTPTELDCVQRWANAITAP